MTDCKTRKEKQKKKRLSRVEIRKIIDAADNLRDRLIIALLYFCGLRPREVASIELDRVDKEERTIEVPDKGLKSRQVPYPRKLDKLFEKYAKKRIDRANVVEEVAKTLRGESKYLFPSREGGHLSTSMVRKVVFRAAEKAGAQEVIREREDGTKIWKVTPRNLRRAFSVHASRDGVAAPCLMRILGYRPASALHRPPDDVVFKSYRTYFEGFRCTPDMDDENDHVHGSK